MKKILSEDYGDTDLLYCDITHFFMRSSSKAIPVFHYVLLMFCFQPERFKVTLMVHFSAA